MSRRTLRAALAVAALPCALAAQGGGTAPNAASVSGGDGKLYVGTYAKTILVFDERTFAVTDTIPVSIGIPYGMWLSSNRKHFYVLDPTWEHVEVIDIATKKSLDKFTLSSGKTKVRIRGLNFDPNGKFAVLLIKTATKQTDRWEIGKPTLVRYDLAKHAVTDTIPWPKGEEREGAQMLFSPNGDLLYLFADEVLIFETKSLKQVDRWELGRALEEGMGRFNFGFPENVYE
ncbi:MAG: YncE family protein, partial [Gemmatimonadaceae bacterium]